MTQRENNEARGKIRDIPCLSILRDLSLCLTGERACENRRALTNNKSLFNKCRQRKKYKKAKDCLKHGMDL